MIAKRFSLQSLIKFLGAQPTVLRYGLAVLAVAIAALGTLYIPVFGKRAAFLLFFFAIIQTAFWLGRNPGLFAMVLSFIAVNTLVLLPAWISEPYNTLILNAGFCVLSSVFIATTSLYWDLTAALLEKQQDLDYAQSIGQIGSWRLNVQRNELRWSDENHRIFGIPKETPMTYEAFLAIVHPEDREYVDRMWQAGLRGEPYDIEHRLVVAGKVSWVRERAILEFGKNGDLLGGFGTTQDITDRKNNELALLESRQRYAGIVESAMDAIITIDANQCILVFNAAAEKMLGCTAEEVIGGSLERFIPKQFSHAHSAHIRAFGRTGATNRRMSFLGAISGLRANGEEFPIEVSISQSGIGDEKTFTAIMRDITERLRGELALQQQLKLQDQLAKTAATVPGVICSFRLRPDGSASMPYASPVFESIYGLSLDAAAEDFSLVFARIHPDDAAHVNETIAESARTLQPWLASFRYNHPSKGEIWIEGHSMPLREMDGSILWHGYIQDVTPRKQVEAALRESDELMRLATDKFMHELHAHQIELEMQNEELRQASIALELSRSHYIELYDFAPVGFMTLTTEGVIAEINLTGAKLLGVERNKLIHRRFAKFIADEHKDRWYIFALRVKQQDGKQGIELPLHREDGTDLFAHIDCQYKNADDGLPMLRIALIDITDRKLAEAALRETETRLALVLEEVKAGYWDWDLNTSTVYLSPAWKRQIGFDENELPNQWKEWECRLHPDDRALVSAATKNYIAGRQPVFELEFRLRHKDGSYRWIHTRGGLLRDPNNKPYRMLGINLDITDYKKTREMNEQRDKMEQSFRLYVAAQTAAAIAHELNQPLTAISAYADVALHLLKTGNQNPQKLSHVLESCAQQAQRAGDVIRQLVTVLHKGETISESIDINHSVHEALDFVRMNGYVGAFNIELDLAAGLPKVLANGLQIQKVLINLLHNGLESMQENGISTGTMTVTTRRSTSDPVMAQVTVCDSGKGMEDSVGLRTMFEPFYKTKSTGLGMGLAISRSLIEAHGGKMWAEQNAGNGISVHFTLPFMI